MTGFLREKWRWLAENRMALLAILVIGLLPFLGFLTSSKQALFSSDQLGAPAWKFYFDSLRSGIVPMWHPYGLGGMPTFDAGFGDGAYPLFLLIGMIMPIETFISWCFIVHVLIAGITAYYLLNRFFRLDRLLATGLAVAYMLNTNFISHIHAGHTGKFYIMAWLPLSLYFLLRSLQKGAQVRHSLGLALTTTLLLSTFHPQFIYYVLIGYFLAWVFKTVGLARDKEYARAAVTAARFWVPILLGIGMVFFLFYPPMQWTKHYGVRGTSEKTTFEHATSWSMHPEETAALVVPEFTGLNERYWGRNPFKLNSEYPGLSVLFLGALGLALFRREKGKWFWLWGGIALLSILFGLGAHTPLFRAFYALVPGIKNFRAPSMMLFWLATALLVMSADVLSRLTRGDKTLTPERRGAWSKRLLQIGLGISGLLILFGLSPGIAFGIWDAVFSAGEASNIGNRVNAQSAFALGSLRSGVLLAALVLATRKWLFKETDPFRFGLALLAVTCIDLMWVNSAFIKTYDPGRYLASQPALETLKSDTAASRVFGIPGAYERWVMQYHGIETTDGWTDNEYRLYREYRGGDYQSNPNFISGLKQNPDGSVSGSPFLDMLNVRRLAFRLQGEGAMRLAPNVSALPRAWFVPAWDTLPEDQVLERMKRPDFDPRKLAFLSGSGLAPRLPKAPAAPVDSAPIDSAPTPATLSPADAVPAAGIREKSRGYNRKEWSVSAPAEGMLVLSELWFPHWRVKVDGKPTELLRTNFAFQGIALSQGEHEVTISYDSPWIRKGLIVAGISLLALIGFLFAMARIGAAAEGRKAGPA